MIKHLTTLCFTCQIMFGITAHVLVNNRSVDVFYHWNWENQIREN